MMRKLLPLLAVIALSWSTVHASLALAPPSVSGGPRLIAVSRPSARIGITPTRAMLVVARSPRHPVLRPAALWLPGPVAWLIEMVGWEVVAYWIAFLGMFVLVAGVLFHSRCGYWPWWCPLNYLGW